MEFITDLFDMLSTVISNLPRYFSNIVDFIESMFSTSSALMTGGSIVAGVLVILLIIKIIVTIKNLI